MGSEQEAEPSSILVNTDLRSPHSSAVTRVRAWTATMGGLSKLSLLLDVRWRRSLVQGEGRGKALSVSPFESEKREDTELARLQAGRWNFGEKTSSMIKATTIQRSINMSYSRMYCP
jgi:hypothetical protein